MAPLSCEEAILEVGPLLSDGVIPAQLSGVKRRANVSDGYETGQCSHIGHADTIFDVFVRRRKPARRSGIGKSYKRYLAVVADSTTLAHLKGTYDMCLQNCVIDYKRDPSVHLKGGRYYSGYMCGETCISMLLAARGVNRTPEQLHIESGGTNRGTQSGNLFLTFKAYEPGAREYFGVSSPGNAAIHRLVKHAPFVIAYLWPPALDRTDDFDQNQETPDPF